MANVGILTTNPPYVPGIDFCRTNLAFKLFIHLELRLVLADLLY